MNKFIILICLLILISCNTQKNKLLGIYEAYFSETSWTLTLVDSTKFIFISEGHGGGDNYRGKYKLSGDTVILLNDSLDHTKFLRAKDDCLIEIETRFDYCKNRPETWGSRKQSINYPQLKTNNIKLKKDVEWMLQIALKNKEILEHIPDTTKNLVIQEYYEITKHSNLKLAYHSKPIIFLSEEEIRKQGIKEYLLIDEVSVGVNSASVHFRIELTPPYPYSASDVFHKKNGQWVHHHSFPGFL